MHGRPRGEAGELINFLQERMEKADRIIGF